MAKIIVITGTPGTGKTTLSKNLAQRLNFLYLDVNKIISKYRLSEGYDRKRRAKIVDVNKLAKFLILEIKNFSAKRFSERKTFGVVIDSHLSHYLPRKYVDLCIVTKCGIKELNKRLKKKKFHKEKIRENLQAEIFDVCLEEAKRKRHRIMVVDTSQKSSTK